MNKAQIKLNSFVGFFYVIFLGKENKHDSK